MSAPGAELRFLAKFSKFKKLAQNEDPSDSSFYFAKAA